MSSAHPKAAVAVDDGPVSSDPPKMDTKQKILEAAEVLFAKKGFDTVSLRNITETAGVNLAAVNYHYGSKEELIFAVLEDRILPLNVERVRRLKEAAETANGQPLPVEVIARSFVGPVLEAVHASSGTDSSLSLLIARFLGDQSDRMQELVLNQFPELAQTFVKEICFAIPHLSPSDALLRLLFSEGSMTHALLYHHRLHLLVDDGFETPNIEQLEEKLVPFVVEGLRGPLPD